MPPFPFIPSGGEIPIAPGGNLIYDPIRQQFVEITIPIAVDPFAPVHADGSTPSPLEGTQTVPKPNEVPIQSIYVAPSSVSPVSGFLEIGACAEGYQLCIAVDSSKQESDALKALDEAKNAVITSSNILVTSATRTPARFYCAKPTAFTCSDNFVCPNSAPNVCVNEATGIKNCFDPARFACLRGVIVAL